MKIDPIIASNLKNGSIFLSDKYVFRIIFVLAAIAYIIFPSILKLDNPLSVDPVVGRVIVGGIILLVFVLSYFIEFIKKNIVYIGYTLSYILSAHYLYLVYLNNLSLGYSVGYLAIIFCVGVLYKSITSLTFYMIFALAGSIFIGILLPEPELNPIVFNSLLVTIIIITFFTLVSRIVIIRDLADKNKILVDVNVEMKLQNEKIENGNKAVQEKQLELKGSNKKLIRANEELSKALDNLQLANQELEIKNIEIEKQKGLYKERKAELEKLGIIAEKTDNSIMVFDSSFKLEWVNDGFHSLFGYGKEDFTNIHGDSIFNISGSPNIKQYVAECINSKKSVAYEVVNASLEGTKIWVQTTLTPIFEEDGSLKKLIAIDSDITKLKEAEEEIKRSSKSKEMFLANTSHELRTPLNGIIGFTNLLLDTMPNEKQLNYINNIKTAGDNLLVVLNDILDLSKIEAGKLTFEQIEFNIKDMIQHLIDSQSIKASEKKLELIHTIDEKIPPTVVGDPVRLNQVLLNLLGNAIKFTPNKGEVNLKLELIRSTPNIRIMFTVIDSGIGMSEEQLKYIFDSFTQGESDTTRKFGGTGLGLSIVKRLIDLQKGKIQVSSILNTGTTFSFYLDFKKGEGKFIKDITKKHVVLGRHHPKNLKILLVEDNEINQQLAMDTIVSWKSDIQVDLAANGRIAIEMMHEQEYNLILMDVQMPEMDGYEATRTIRKDLPFPKNRTPIVAMTAHAMQKEKDNCLKMGMNDYISKPFEPEELFIKIKTYTSKAVMEAIQSKQPLEITNIAGNIAKPQSDQKGEKPITSSIQMESFKMINLENLNKIYKGDLKKIQKIVGMYVATIPKEISELKENLENENWDVLKAKAHTLKPKMSYLGLKELHESSKSIELFAKERESLDKIPALIKTIENGWDIAMQEINQFLS